jgi:hypothetical protein
MSIMSGIGSVTSSPYLQRLRDGQTGRADRMDQASNMALQAMGVDSTKAASITKQIQSAVQDATKNSNGSSDKRAAIQQAVDGVLNQNGIDPEQYKTQVQAAMKKLGGNKQGRPPQAAAPKQATSTTSTPQEEAMETYADTLKEALAGDQQAVKKLAADEEARAERTGASTSKDTGANEAAAATQGNESGIDVNA